ncbi:MAG: translation initiation factor IF-3, partial [Rhodospirillales bacterium]
IKLRPGIEQHDYSIKMKAARKFLDNGDKVKVTMRFRGRELAHQEIGAKVLDRVREELDEAAKIEQLPKMEGRQLVMVVSPR